MEALITGGMGVIGAETSRKFVKEGHRPVIFARHRDETLVGDILEQTDIELGDIVTTCRGCSTPSSGTGHAHRPHRGLRRRDLQANPALSVQVNVMGTVNVLEAARLFDIKRVVYTSAKGVYGPVLGEYGAPTYKPMPEDLPKNPKRIYNSAKLMGEHVVALLPGATWASTWSCCASLRPTGPARPRGTARWASPARSSKIRPAVSRSTSLRAARKRTISSTTRTSRSASISPRWRKSDEPSLQHRNRCRATLNDFARIIRRISRTPRSRSVPD